MGGVTLRRAGPERARKRCRAGDLPAKAGQTTGGRAGRARVEDCPSGPVEPESRVLAVRLQERHQGAAIEAAGRRRSSKMDKLGHRVEIGHFHPKIVPDRIFLDF